MKIRPEPVDVPAFRALLDGAKTERPIVEFLKKAPWVVYWTFCRAGGHDRYAIFEFPLSNELQCDLLLLNSYSGAWEALFVELEPADDPVFTKNGVPGSRLAIAQRQIDDWQTFIEQHRDLVRADMVRYAKARDRLKYSRRKGEPCNVRGDRLSDPKTHIWFKFKIVIGRSSRMNEAARRLLGRYAHQRNTEVVTYDRLLRLAEYRYEGRHRDGSGYGFDDAP